MRWKLKGKEASSLYKIAVGILIMGLGFMFMRFASSDYEVYGKSAMYWLVLAYLCHTCHSSKTSEDRARMNVEDSNVYMSRFSKEVWDAFVESRRPTQHICNLNEASDGQCLEIDVRSCRLNGIFALALQ